MQPTVKILGMFFILLSSVCFGFYKSYALERRVSELKKILTGSNRLKEYIANCPAEIQNIYNSCYGVCRDVYLNDNKILVKQGCISKEDKEILDEFFGALGSLDLKSEHSRVNLYSELISKQIQFAEDEARQKSKVWQTCGICVGIGAVILMM